LICFGSFWGATVSAAPEQPLLWLCTLQECIWCDMGWEVRGTWGSARLGSAIVHSLAYIYIYMYVPNARHQPGAADILGLGLSRRSAPPGWCALGQSSRSAPPAGQPRTPARPPFAYPPANHRPVAGHPPANRPPPCPPPGGHSLAGPVLHHIAPYALYYDWRTWLQFLCYLIDLAHMVLVFVAIYYTW
jgi:hypothetical protein